MATTPAARTGEARAPTAGGYPEEGSGWVLFAGVMVGTAGILNVIYGIAAISNSSFFVNNARFIFSGLNTWGWIMLVFGALQVTAALSILAGRSFGRWFGIGVAALNAIAALLAVPAYPLWSLAIFTLDLLVIYGLTAYGGNRRLAA